MEHERLDGFRKNHYEAMINIFWCEFSPEHADVTISDTSVNVLVLISFTIAVSNKTCK